MSSPPRPHPAEAFEGRQPSVPAEPEASPAIVVEGLRKRFGNVEALRGVDLQVREGTVLGLLGPNGAGKTTTVRILSTLETASEGRVSVLGHDVAAEPDRVRRSIGLTGQFAAVDDRLTGFHNLVLVGQLSRLRGAAARRRADELLERFELVEARDRHVATYSGGMRRRLDLAASLIAQPPVLVLDEPTTGLDPRSRRTIWEVVEALVEEGTTVLLTSQYLEEVDRLAHRVAVMDAGRVVAEGTSDELKAQVGGARIVITVADAGDQEAAVAALRSHADGEPRREGSARTWSAPITAGSESLYAVVRELEAGGVEVDDLAVRRPSLDDVFLTLTGHRAEADEETAEP